MRGRKVSGLTAVYSRNENLSKYARRGKVRFSSSSSSPPDNLCRYRGHYVRKFSRPTFSLLLSHSVYLTLCICRTIVIYTKIIVKLGGKELWRTIFLKIGQNLKRSSDNFSPSENRRSEFMRKFGREEGNR